MPHGGADSLLPLALDAGSKRVLDLIALWPLLSLADLKDLLGVSRARALQLLDRPLRLGLVMRIRHGGRTRYVVGDRGLAFHARRDRLAASQALRRWSPSRGTAEIPFSWQGVRGSRTRQLARHMGHTVAVHSFMAAMSRQAGETGSELTEAEPPHRAGRTYRTATGYGALNPDAYGLIETGHDVRHFFLELERRAEGEGAVPGEAPALPPLLRQRTAVGDVRGMALCALRLPRRDCRDGLPAVERRGTGTLRGG